MTGLRVVCVGVDLDDGFGEKLDEPAAILAGDAAADLALLLAQQVEIAPVGELARLRDLAERAIALLEARTDASSRRFLAKALRKELAP